MRSQIATMVVSLLVAIPGLIAEEAKTLTLPTISCRPVDLDEKCKSSEGDKPYCIYADGRKVTPRDTSFKQRQTLRVVLLDRNPFAYQYKLDIAEKQIADDDISSFLKSLSPAPSGTKAAAKLRPQPEKVVPGAPVSMMIILPKTASDKLDKLKGDRLELDRLIAGKFGDYNEFLPAYENLRAQLKAASGCIAINRQAQSLFDKAQTKRNELLEDEIIRANINALSTEYTNFAQQEDRAAAEARAAINVQSQKASTQELTRSDIPAVQQALADLGNADSISAALQQEKNAVIRLECMYLKFKTTQVGGIQSGILTPLVQRVSRHKGFWDVTLEGPFADPTSVTWTLKEKEVQDEPAVAANYSPASAEVCSQELLTSSDFAAVGYTAAAAPSSLGPAAQKKYVSGAGIAESNPSGKSPGSDPPPAPATDDGYTRVASRQLNFGGPRFALSTGVAFGIMSNPQYERVSGVPLDDKGQPVGTVAKTVVGLKTQSGFRVVPVSLLHARLFKVGNEAIYATAGIGVHSDNKGASPEYVFGLSQSVLDHRLFLTAGAYVGEQQRLANGLFLRRDVSDIQGDLPVVRDLKVRFGFAISYRILGSSENKK